MQRKRHGQRQRQGRGQTQRQTQHSQGRRPVVEHEPQLPEELSGLQGGDLLPLDADAHHAAVHEEHARARVALAEEDLAVGQGSREEVRRDLAAAVVAGAAEEGGGDVPDADPA